MNTESESESGEGGSETKDSFRVSRHLYAFIQCGAFLLWLVVACMFLVQRERRDSGRKLDNIPVHHRSRQQQWVSILRGFFRFEEPLEAFCLIQRCVGTCLAVQEIHQVRSAMGGPLAV